MVIVGAGKNAEADRRPDSQQLIRQWALLRLLADASEPYSVKQLADQLDVSKATIERDLATLERDFAVIEESAGKQKKVYRIDHKIRALETLTFGTTELLALYAAQNALAALSGTRSASTPRSRGASKSAPIIRRSARSGSPTARCAIRSGRARYGRSFRGWPATGRSPS